MPIDKIKLLLSQRIYSLLDYYKRQVYNFNKNDWILLSDYLFIYFCLQFYFRPIPCSTIILYIDVCVCVCDFCELMITHVLIKQNNQSVIIVNTLFIENLTEPMKLLRVKLDSSIFRIFNIKINGTVLWFGFRYQLSVSILVQFNTFIHVVFIICSLRAIGFQNNLKTV